MNIKQLLSDDEGVSPVIGVILMVAITVILAAVIAAFVLGLGDSDDVAPQTSFDFDYEEGEEITVTATSGDTIDQDNLEIVGDGDFDGVTDPFDDPVTAGSTETLDDNDFSDTMEEGDEIRIVWESDDGDDSSVLASFEFPDEDDDIEN